MAACHQLPGRLVGCWNDINSVGYREGEALPNITTTLLILLKPLLFSKFYPPLALLILGVGAWCFFHRIGLFPLACALGAIAAVLNGSFFSSACWGVGSQAIMIGLMFLALAALTDTPLRYRWVRGLIAGLAIGIAVSEGADVGALFSLGVAAYAIYQGWNAEGPRIRNLTFATTRLAIVSVFAGLVAFRAISGLLATNVEGIAGTDQDEQTREGRWDWATQWSLPKAETLSLVVPGLFGYRNDTAEGGEYWGSMGRSAAWEKYLDAGGTGPIPKGFVRYSGGGFYAGVAVVLLAFWAGAQAFRREKSVFNLRQRRWLWFWMAFGFVCLLLAFGRHAPFYRWFYESLPYSSTVRNPTKFIDPLSFCLIILFAHGVDGLWRKYMAPAVASRGWTSVPDFDRNWVRGCGLVLAAAVLGWMAYFSQRDSLVNYLKSVRFDDPHAQAVASFSVWQPMWFVLFFGLAAGLMFLIMRGAFAGPQARWVGGTLLGLILVVDLGRANQPWIVYWNYAEKYRGNPIIDRLCDHPEEHRIAILPLITLTSSLMGQLYRIEWMQNEIPYHNIQSLDLVQLARKPKDMAAFEQTFLRPTNTADYIFLLPRCWQLANVRYLFGKADFVGFLNTRTNDAWHDFHIAERFNIIAKPGILQSVRPADWTAEPAENGTWALFEFDGALPRAGLYTQWETATNDAAALTRIANPNFDPTRSVLVTGGVPGHQSASETNEFAGSVAISSYAPRDVVLAAHAQKPCVLLLNDRFDANWHGLVDGRPAPLLRCNYLMRGVYLDPGVHTVEFRFQPPILRSLFVSLAAIGVGVLAVGWVAVGIRKQPPADKATNGYSRPQGQSQPQSKPQSKPEAEPEVPARGKQRNKNGSRQVSGNSTSAARPK